MLCHLGDKLWWADQGTDQIGTCDKKDGGSWKVLRNSTSPMMHMKIYNETVQKGAGPADSCSIFVEPVCFAEVTLLRIFYGRSVLIAACSLFIQRTSAHVSVNSSLILFCVFVLVLL